MNVNPFSYLIEKLKSKVSKSGDTMTGILDIQRPSGNNAFLKTTNTTNNLVMGVGIDGDGVTRGIYDYGINNWLFNTDGTNVYVNNTKVPYNGGTLALKSDIPTQNNLTSYETIDSYNSASNKYTCPSDGYIYVSNSTNANDGGVLISGSDDTNFLIMGGNKGYFPLFVRKGMKCYCYGNIERAYFFPLS